MGRLGGTAVTIVLYALAAIVAAAAGWTSFDALEHLGVLCGFAPDRAWLLPVTVDVGAVAGAVAWLRGRRVRARRYGKCTTLGLIATSIAGNGVTHLLDAAGARPSWWLLVAVTSVPSAVLGVVVHLVLLTVGAPSGDQQDDATGERESERADALPEPHGHDEQAPPAGEPGATPIAKPVGRRRLAEQLGISEWEARERLKQQKEARAA